MLAVWLPPGVTLPTTWNEEPLVLAKRKLMGVESNGMLAGADELGFGDVHEAIVEIDPNDAKPGDDFATVFDLNDILLDIENKSLTHRPDCFGVIGFAREVAGILGQEFHEPEWLVVSAKSYVVKSTAIESNDE
jgi:phenylalanyl-tRNA synthetase beta chain